MFKVNNKETRTMSMTSFRCHYCRFWTDLRDFKVIVNFNDLVKIDTFLVSKYQALKTKPINNIRSQDLKSNKYIAVLPDNCPDDDRT